MREKKEFSDRLREAMKARGLEPSAAALEPEFNAHWMGEPVRRQTVWKWLNGQAIPRQDKLQVLAKLLLKEPDWLRFGDHVVRHVRAREKQFAEGVTYIESETFNAFLQLPVAQRKIIREVIEALAKANKIASG